MNKNDTASLNSRDKKTSKGIFLGKVWGKGSGEEQLLDFRARRDAALLNLLYILNVP